MGSIKIRISEDQMRMLKEMAATCNSSPEGILEQLAVEAISNGHLIEIGGPRDYFEGRSRVSSDEAARARTAVVDSIVSSVGDLRPEAVLSGLIGAAWDLAVRLCRDARYKHPQQHASFLIGEMVQALDFKDCREQGS